MTKILRIDAIAPQTAQLSSSRIAQKCSSEHAVEPSAYAAFMIIKDGMSHAVTPTEREATKAT